MSTTTTAGRYFADRFAGRYRVFDSQGGGHLAVVVATCSSKAKAEEKAAKLNADAAPLAADLAEAPAVVAEQVTAVEEAPADTRSARATELADAVAAGQVSFDAAATELLGGAHAEMMDARAKEQVAAEAAPAAEETKAYRIGKVLREFVLSRPVAPGTGELVAHIVGRNVCYDGTATLRLTRPMAERLIDAAGDLETTALSGEFQAKAPAVMAARAARRSLYKLFG